MNITKMEPLLLGLDCFEMTRGCTNTCPRNHPRVIVKTLLKACFCKPLLEFGIVAQSTTYCPPVDYSTIATKNLNVAIALFTQWHFHVFLFLNQSIDLNILDDCYCH